MTHLSTTSLGDYLDALAAATPAPGGGSAAGIAGAMGAALVEMVAGLSLAKSSAAGAEHSGLQRAAIERARSARVDLLQLAEDDAVAYGAFMDALKLPKSSDAERTARTSAISAAAQRAAEVPLATLRAAVAVAEAARSMLDKSLLAAASDLEVAARFARAAGESAAENVEANLPYIEDPQTRAEIAHQTSAALTALHRATPQ
ncbi:MAG: cyclodeaminase/cyclohydrolase family protein [Chloroflexota bacterium]